MQALSSASLFGKIIRLVILGFKTDFENSNLEKQMHNHRAYKLDEDNILFFPTRFDQIIKRLEHTLKHTYMADQFREPILYFSYEGACIKLCDAIDRLEQLSGLSTIKLKSDSDAKPNKTLLALYELRDKYMK